KDKPFFAYVAFNAPHSPHQVPDADAAPYHKLAPAKIPADTANVYGMIANMDGNFGRLMKALDDAKLADDTIVVFLTDNGPDTARFNAGLRDRKGTVYEGGIRVPCYVRWPGKVKPGRVVEQPAAHIDLTPTLLGLCGVERGAKGPMFDGRDL